MIILKRDNVEKIVDSEEKAIALEAKGYKRLVTEKPTKEEEVFEKSEMTKAQLLEYAEKHGIKVNPRARKADILAAL